MRVLVPIGSGSVAVIVEVTAAITGPGNVDPVPLIVLCSVSFLVTAALVALVQWYDQRQQRQHDRALRMETAELVKGTAPIILEHFATRKELSAIQEAFEEHAEAAGEEFDAIHDDLNRRDEG